MINEISEEKFARYFEGISTAEENREILRWSNKNPENKQLFSNYVELWKITNAAPGDFNPDINLAWEKISKKIDDYEKVTTRSYKNLAWYISRVAAVFVIGFVLYFMISLNSNSELIYVKHSSLDSKEKILLPDGSKVWLNKKTDLEYVKDFSDEARFVKLNGEAFFEVAKDPDKPFIIESAHSRIKVLGTSFNYKAYPLEKENVLNVSSGKVEFANISKTKEIFLEKGEKAELNIGKDLIEKSTIDDQNYLAWKTGILVFENENLENTINVISNYYSKQFEFSSEEKKSGRITVTFDNQKLDDVLRILELTMNVTFQKNTKKIIIK